MDNFIKQKAEYEYYKEVREYDFATNKALELYCKTDIYNSDCINKICNLKVY